MENVQEILQNLHFTHAYWSILLPVLLMILDVLTGWLNAYKKDELSSKKMRDGIIKKSAEIVMIVVGMLIKYSLGVPAVSEFITIYMCWMEILSLVENYEKLGGKLPEGFKNKLNGNSNNDENTEV